ncbi:MAG: hypothetical protein K2K91_09175 [Ruminococcus sp.]|nr:hypothetical protein [Ruminococcus sp.]
MKVYEIELNRKQYARLEKMLTYKNAGRLARNQPINGYELLSAVIEKLYSPVEDGWSTLEVILAESDEELELLKYITRHIIPDDEDYFVRQLGKKFNCKKNFEIKIELKF